MSQFHLAENLTQLRRNKGITQEKLADFLGISKASVSKWETGQSLPDIAQLPRLAAFYDVTIDELMGYEPQLTMGEIKKYYERFAENFVTNGFEETLSKVKDFIRMYYSCDMAVLQMIILLMNHLTMVVEDTKRAELLEEMIELCKHIEEHSEDANDFLTGDIRMKGDAYFDKLDGYFEKMDEYLMLPRNPQMVLSTLVQDLSNPVFAPLFDNPEYQKLLILLKKILCNS